MPRLSDDRDNRPEIPDVPERLSLVEARALLRELATLSRARKQDPDVLDGEQVVWHQRADAVLLTLIGDAEITRLFEQVWRDYYDWC